MTALTVSPVFTVGERVIAEAVPEASLASSLGGGPGEVTSIESKPAGDYWIWVMLDGATDAYPYFAHQLRREPTV